MQQLNIQPLIRISIIFIILSVIFLIYYFLFQYIYPFVIAFIISILLQPIITYVETNFRVNRSVASYLTIIFIVSTISIFIYLIFQQIMIELSQVITQLPVMFKKINLLFIEFGQTTFLPIYDNLQTKLLFLPKTSNLEIEKTIPYITGKLYESSNDLITNIILSTSTMITSVTQASVVIIFISISVFMMTKDFNNLKQGWQQLIPVKIRKKTSEVFFHLKKSTFGLIKAQFFLACLTSFIVFIVFLIMGVNHLIVLTLFIFLVDFIPYIGIGVIFIPWIIYSFLNGDYVLSIQLISLYMFIIIIRQFIEPKMIASQLHIHPLIALFILFVSIQYFGIGGIIFTPIILIILSAIYHANIFTYIWHFIFDKK